MTRPLAVASVLSLLLALSIPGHAQQVGTPCPPSLDIATVRARAADASVSADALQLQAEANIARASANGRWSGPMLSVGIAALPVHTRFGPAWAQVGIAQAIPALGSLQRAAAPSLSTAERLDAQANAVRLNDVRDATTAWIDWQLAGRMRELLLQQQANLQAVHALTADLISTDAAPQLDLLRVAEAVERAQFATIEWGRRQSQARSALARFVRCDVPADSGAAGTIALTQPLPELASLQADARQARPTIDALLAQQREELARINAARDTGRPQFTVGAMWTTIGRRVDDMPAPMRGTDALMGTVTVAIPGPRRVAANERAAAWELSAEATSLALENEYRRGDETIERLHADILLLEQQLALLDTSIVPLQRDQFDAVIDALVTGDADADDALQITQAMLSTLSEQAQLQAEVLRQWAELDWWTGGTLLGDVLAGGAP